MIKIYYLLFFIVTVSPVFADGLMLYYPFNGNSYDMSINRSNGIEYGFPKYSDGVKSQSVLLDGTDDYIKTKSVNFNSEMTVCLWVYFPRLETSRQTLVSKYDDKTDGNNTELFRTFDLSKLESSFSHRFQFNVSQNGRQSQGITSKTAAKVKQWYHIASVFDHGMIKLYVNGTSEAMIYTDYSSLYNSSVPIIIGVMYHNRLASKPYSDMKADDFRIYNRVLSDSEIEEQYLNLTGPIVQNHSPTGLIKKPIQNIELSFNKPILESTLTDNNIVIKSPKEIIPIESKKSLGNNIWQISFREQTDTGKYTIKVGPHILDLAGNESDQNQNGKSGETTDYYEGSFQLSVIPQDLLFLSINGKQTDTEAQRIVESLKGFGANVTYLLMNSNTEDEIVSRLGDINLEQVWVLDLSYSKGNFTKAIPSIGEWFRMRSDRAIICDGRIRSSFWNDDWKITGKLLVENYYENIKIAGSGLVLATDHSAYQNDINTINEHIGIEIFKNENLAMQANVDTNNQLMNFPNSLGQSLDSGSTSGLAPYGQQANGRILYNAGWASNDNSFYAITSTFEGKAGFHVNIIKPLSEDHYYEKHKIIFHGTASNATNPVEYNWYSGSQLLGVGDTIELSNLKVGVHEIILKATDFANGSDQDSIRLIIEEFNANQLKVYSFTNSLLFAWSNMEDSISGHKVYFNNDTKGVLVEADETEFEASGLSPSTAYPFKITLSSNAGIESSGVEITGVTLMPNPDRLSVGAYSEYLTLGWNAVEPKELIKHYAVYVSAEDFNDIGGMIPSVITKGTSATIGFLQNGATYFFGVTTVNLSEGELIYVKTITGTPVASNSEDSSSGCFINSSFINSTR